MKRIVRSAIVEHAAPAMYALVADVDAYPQFLPWCREVRVAPGRDAATLVVGLKGLSYELATAIDLQPHRAIDLTLLEGPFRRFEAHWRFTPLGAKAARVEYVMEYEFAGALVSRALGPLFDSIANTLVDAFLRRADALYGQAAH